MPARQAREFAVGRDGLRKSNRTKHRKVVDAVAVGTGLGKVDATLVGHSHNGFGFEWTVKNALWNSACVTPLERLGACSYTSGEAETLREHLR